MARERINPKLRSRANDYFDYFWVRKQGAKHEDLFVDMPAALQAEVALSGSEAMLRESPVFGECKTGFLVHFLRCICFIRAREHCHVNDRKLL